MEPLSLFERTVIVFALLGMTFGGLAALRQGVEGTDASAPSLAGSPARATSSTDAAGPLAPLSVEPAGAPEPQAGRVVSAPSTEAAKLLSAIESVPGLADAIAGLGLVPAPVPPVPPPPMPAPVAVPDVLSSMLGG